MRIRIRPVAEPRREIDVTRALVGAIAHELWRLYGGNSEVNWLEAERHLTMIAAVQRTPRRGRRVARRVHPSRRGRMPGATRCARAA